MQKFKGKIRYVLILFAVETFLQIVFSTVLIKYFDQYSIHERIGKIFSDGLYMIGTIKLVFFLPLYLTFYLTFNSKTEKLVRLTQSGYHSLLFLIIYLLLSLLLPGNIAKNIIEVIMLAFISFITSYLLLRTDFDYRKVSGRK